MNKSTKMNKKGKLQNISELADIIGMAVASRHNTFKIHQGFVECDLGGSFMPTCAEMKVFAARTFDDAGKFSDTPIDCAYKFIADETLDYNNAASRFYYEPYKKYTNIGDIGVRINGLGVFEISVVAETSISRKTVLRDTLFFGDSFSEKIIGTTDFDTLPPNCSLYFSAKCLGAEGIVRGFRWFGHVTVNDANFGERIFAIRTYGNSRAVRNTLKAICGHLARHNQDVLKRCLFIIYDASEKTLPEPVSSGLPGARVLELIGPNFGGGGNASTLISALLRVNKNSAANISEIIIMDDDAKIDAETIVRQDAFITARKANIISTAVVYQASHPTVVQEYGGFWGKFFSPRSCRVSINGGGSARTLMPYLVRSTRDVGTMANARYLGNFQDAEFATFIFISFPFDLLAKAGAPFPFFLRNDDVEICLRCLALGASLCVNSNIHAWHEARHNPVSEFYAILHGMIVNVAYGVLDKEYFYTLIFERIGKLARARNCVLLQAYALVLEKFAQGPHWLKPETIFSDYQQCRAAISSMSANYLSKIPVEVADCCREYSQVINISDNSPPAPEKDEIIFIDIFSQTHYLIDKKMASESIPKLMESCVSSLEKLMSNYEQICSSWKKAVESFDHVAFWDSIFADKSLELRLEQLEFVLPREESKQDDFLAVRLVSQIKKTEMSNLPIDFTESGYLANNPDVASSGMKASEHWLKFGQYEGRRY